MKTLFLIYTGGYSDRRVVRVFSTGSFKGPSIEDFFGKAFTPYLKGIAKTLDNASLARTLVKK